MKTKLFLGLLLISGNSFSQAPRQDLVFEYKLDNNLNDTSNNNVGSLQATGTVNYVEGVEFDPEHAVKLNSNKLTKTGIQQVQFIDDQITLSFWMKKDNSIGTAGEGFTIVKISSVNKNTNGVHSYLDIYKGNNSHLYTLINNIGVYTGGSPKFLIGGRDVPNVVNNEWHHIIVRTTKEKVQSDTKYHLELFVDGVRAAGSFKLISGANLFKGINVQLGENNSSPNTSDLQLDNIRFYKRPLTNTEIRDLYKTDKADCKNYVNIPDANFKRLLVSNFDTNADGELCKIEALKVTGKFNVYNEGIRDLTGIEAFENITELNCENNDLSANPNLDFSNNTKLQKIYCSKTKINSLNVKNCLDLERLHFAYNNVKNVDLSKNSKLKYISCQGGEVENLDISENKQIKEVYVQNNRLYTLNLRNGFNNNITKMYATGNHRLNCIQTDDDKVGRRPVGWMKEYRAGYNANCGLSANNYDLNKMVDVYPNPVSNTLHINTTVSIAKVSVYNVLGKKVLETSAKKIDVNSLFSGVYMLKLKSTDGKVATKKFIKH